MAGMAGIDSPAEARLPGSIAPVEAGEDGPAEAGGDGDARTSHTPAPVGPGAAAAAAASPGNSIE
jgi:hypothetical protein